MIRERFSRAIARQLEAIAWWDWSREELEARFDHLNDVETFIRLYGKQEVR